MPYNDLDKSDSFRERAGAEPLFILGGATLTFIAGFVNATSLMYFHVPVSHMTGVLARISIDLATVQIPELLSLLYILLGFFAGTVVSGFVIGATNLKPKKEYGLILLLEAACLVVALAMFVYQINFGLAFVSFACGMQNAMASTYLGLIVRTTHVTGLVTDLGILVGQIAKHRRVKRWKIFFFCTLLGGFFLGGVFAMLAYRIAGFYALLIPAALCIISSLTFYWVRLKPEPA